MLNVFDTLNSPSMLHAAIVHFPIALAGLGLLVVALLAYFNDKMPLRWLAISIYALCVVSGWIAEASGENAMDLVSNQLPGEIWDLIGEHQEMGERVLLLAAVTLIFLVVSLIEHDGVRKLMTLFSLAAGVVTFGWVGLTAHYGGVLVYQHGVGTPMSHVGYEDARSAAESSGDIPVHEIDLAEAEHISFQNDVWPILEAHCLSCHESPDPDGDYAMDTLDLIMAGGPKGGPGVVPGKPDESSIVLYIRGMLTPRMPKKKDPLSEEQLHIIRSWIAAGARSGEAASAEDDAPEEPAVLPAFDPFAPAESAPPADAQVDETAPPVFDPFGGTSTPSVPDTEQAVPEPIEDQPDPVFDPFAAPSDAPGVEEQGVQIEENSEQLEPTPVPEAQPEAVPEPESATPEAERQPAPPETPREIPRSTPAKRNPLFDPFAA